MDVKAIIFDKDGTLIDFGATFNPATAHVIKTISDGDEATQIAIARELGFDLDTGLIEDHSVVIAGDGMDITKAVAKILPISDLETYRIELDAMFGEACLKR